MFIRVPFIGAFETLELSFRLLCSFFFFFFFPHFLTTVAATLQILPTFFSLSYVYFSLFSRLSQCSNRVFMFFLSLPFFCYLFAKHTTHNIRLLGPGSYPEICLQFLNPHEQRYYL